MGDKDLEMLKTLLFPNEREVSLIEKRFSVGKYSWSRYYKCSRTDGILAYSNSSQDEFDCLVQLGGSYLSALGPIDVRGMLEDLTELGFKPTRIDICIDCPLELRLLDKLHEAVDERLILGARGGKFIKGLGNQSGQDTLYIGSRNSNNFYRCYNTEPNHSYRAERLELETKQAQARKVWEEIMTVSTYRVTDDKFSKAWQDKLASLLLGQITPCQSIERKKNRAIKSKEFAPFWQELIEKAGACTPSKLRIDRKPITLDDTFKWMSRQVAPNLAMMRDGLGEERFRKYIDALCKEGSSRHNNEHKARIAVLQKDRPIYEQLLEGLG